MWPTFDSLLLALGIEPLEIVCRLQGRVLRDTGLGATVIPTPTCGRAGDMQIVLYTQLTNGTPTYDTAIFGTTPGKFTIYSRADNFASGVWCAARELASSGDPDFYVSQVSGNLILQYQTFILRNSLNPSDPVRSVVQTRSSLNSNFGLTNNLVGRGQPFAPSSLPVQESDLILSTCTNDNGVGTLAIPSEGGNVLYSVAQEDASSTPYDIAATISRPGIDIVRLTSAGITDWTTAGLNSAGTGAGMPRFEQDTGNSRHGLYADVSLESGKTYVLMVDLWNAVGGSGTSSHSFMLSVEDPSTSEHGFATNSSGNSLLAFGATADDDYGGTFFVSRSGSFAGGYFLLYTATATGTHRFWICSGRQSFVATAPGSFTFAGNASYDFTVGALDILEMPAGFNKNTWALPAPFIGNEFDASLGSAIAAPRNRDAALSGSLTLSQAQEPTFLLGGAASRPVNRMIPWAGMRRVVRYGTDGLDQPNSNSVPMAGSSTWRVHVRSDHVISRRNGDKLYYEFNHTVHTGGVGCGLVAVGVRGDDPYHNNLARTSSSLIGLYMGYSDGEYRAWSVAGGTGLAVWADGDIIGVLLDFVNEEIVWTVNGTVWATLAMQQNADPHSAFAAIITAASNASNNSAHRHTLNLRGPFSYKPVGAVAYDFDNELT